MSDGDGLVFGVLAQTHGSVLPADPAGLEAPEGIVESDRCTVDGDRTDLTRVIAAIGATSR
ncbi:hypothetical protein ACWEO2_27950 [Nocardia sp. NPDC004278]